MKLNQSIPMTIRETKVWGGSWLSFSHHPAQVLVFKILMLYIFNEGKSNIRMPIINIEGSKHHPNTCVSHQRYISHKIIKVSDHPTQQTSNKNVSNSQKISELKQSLLSYAIITEWYKLSNPEKHTCTKYLAYI